MASSYAALQKRLDELEAEVKAAAENPTATTAPLSSPEPPPFHHGGDISWKIGFVRAFLAAEMESHAGAKPDHLDRMVSRLSTLERALLGRAEESEPTDSFATEPPCSGTPSCLSEAEEDDKDEEGEEEKGSSRVGNPESTTVASVEGEKGGERKQGGRTTGWNCVGVGAAIAVSVIGLAVANFLCAEETVFLVPT